MIPLMALDPNNEGINSLKEKIGLKEPEPVVTEAQPETPVQPETKLGPNQVTYEVKAPDGRTIEVVGPKGASRKEVLKRAKKYYAQQTEFEDREWGDVPKESVMNSVSSFGDFLGGMYQFVTNPVESLEGLGNAVEGAVYNSSDLVKNYQAKRYAEKAIEWGKKADAYREAGNKKALKHALEQQVEYDTRIAKTTGTASALGQYLTDRYGGEQEIKRTIAKDPFGFFLDLTAVMSGGGTIVPRLSRYAKTIDPIANTAKLSKATGRGLASVTDMLTGRVGQTAFLGAIKAGADDASAFLTRKPSASAGFRKQMTGKPGYDGERLVDMAQDAVSNFRQARNAQYAKTMAGAETMDLTNAFRDLSEQLAKTKDKFAMHKGQVVDKDMANFLADIEKEVLYFKNKPELHDLVGMDKLKQNIQNKIEQLPLTATAKKTAGTEIASSIRNTLKKNNPQYAKAMDDYAEATKFIQDDLGSLGLANRGKTDNILRKLTSMTRDGVNTNFGARSKAITKLADFGSEGKLIPEIIGNAFSNWTPRGVGGAVAGAGGAGAVAGGFASIPTALAFMMAQSPRVVGEILYALGATTGVPAKLLNALATNPKFTQVVAPYINMQQTAIGQ